MVVSCYPTGIMNLKYPRQGIMDLSNAGFEYILLDMGMYYSTDILEEAKFEKGSTFGSALESFLYEIKKHSITIFAAYAPYLKRNSKRENLCETFVGVTEDCIHLCGEIGCHYLVVRPLFVGVEHGNEWRENQKYYLHFAQLAKENHITLLLENQCRDIGGHLVRGICAEGDVAAEWVDKLNAECGEERFGFCMDSGVCNICGQNMYEMARALGKRLKMVILRDCDGHRESAMLPFTCAYQRQSQTDWLSLIRGLREIGFDGHLALNMTDTAAAFSPLLRPHLLTMAKSVADYFKWQIEIETILRKYPNRVLFGAGNMCRNYMKCYGDQYPPLFTCDNNKALWGTSFCGLEVKSPEALKEISPDCAVFLCNIYYREIEQQLRDMGIKNPIAYFNDEYMPSFHFDRIERA
ncbi:MAG: sugar phosphate isomerase/epimerase [Lachnospiraceae bacterium]|nr:sugar phosphate isomerase/epimerase [Lachnospiraceae bacterium]